jgi:hypothetical protein
MRRPNKAFAANPVGPLEDRLTLSHTGVHSAALIGHDPSAMVDHNHTALAGHHHAARLRHHHARPVPPVAAPHPTGTTTSPPATGSSPPATGSGPTAATVVLSGTVEGQTPLDGSGTVGPLGAVTSTGTLTAWGAEPVTYAGTITLVGATGSVTASLSGLLFGPDRLGETINLTYTITGGTGAFQGASGSGKASFTAMNSSTATAANGFVLAFGDASSTTG